MLKHICVFILIVHNTIIHYTIQGIIVVCRGKTLMKFAAIQR